MTAQAKATVFSRILVSLDATRSSQTALESAAFLAEALQYELVGVFVEDSDLMRLAGLPFSRIVRSSGVIEALDPAALQKEVEAHAAAARHAIRQVALRRRLRWSFRSIRGDIGTAFSSAAEAVDIVCISRRSTDRYRRAPVQNPIRMAMERRSPVLVAGKLSDRIDKPIAVIVDRVDGVAERVRLAGQIAAKAKTGIVVLEVLPLDADIAALRERVAALLPQGVATRTVLIGRDDPCGLLDSLRRDDYSLVVYGVGADKTTPAWLDYVADAGECPLLLVPETQPAPA